MPLIGCSAPVLDSLSQFSHHLRVLLGQVVVFVRVLPDPEQVVPDLGGQLALLNLLHQFPFIVKGRQVEVAINGYFRAKYR